MRDQNYATITDYQPWPSHDPGWFMLEWDVALDRQGRDLFAANALERPDRVRVAPYWLHPLDGRGPTQVHRGGGLPIPEGQTHADSFGLGCIYFPQSVLDEFLQDPPPCGLVRKGVLNDVVFSDWHRAKHPGDVDVDWSVRPQHIHGD